MLISLLVDIEKKSSTQVKIFLKSAGQVLTSSTDFYGPWSACRSVSSRGSYHDEMASVPQCVHVRSTHSRAWHPGSKAHRVLCDKSWMDLMWSCFSTQRLSLQHQLNISHFMQQHTLRYSVFRCRTYDGLHFMNETYPILIMGCLVLNWR